MGLHRIRENLHQKILRLRSIETMFGSLKFDRLWQDSDAKKREEVLKYIKDEDRVRLMKWIKNHSSLALGEMPLKQLRDLARSLLVCNWSRMNKAELITGIKEAGHGFEQG